MNLIVQTNSYVKLLNTNKISKWEIELSCWKSSIVILVVVFLFSIFYFLLCPFGSRSGKVEEQKKEKKYKSESIKEIWFWEDLFLVGQGRKCLNPTKNPCTFLFLPNNLIICSLSFLFYSSYFTSDDMKNQQLNSSSMKIGDGDEVVQNRTCLGK